jgi:acrylyl-CoA reductase (NADPH)
MDRFRAFRIFNDEGKVHGRVVETALGELTAGDVVIQAAYSSVNYKDALAATGPRIIRTFPRIGGIDVAGTVVTSTDRMRSSSPVMTLASPTTVDMGTT